MFEEQPGRCVAWYTLRTVLRWSLLARSNRQLGGEFRSILPGLPRAPLRGRSRQRHPAWACVRYLVVSARLRAMHCATRDCRVAWDRSRGRARLPPNRRPAMFLQLEDKTMLVRRPIRNLSHRSSRSPDQ